MNAKQGDICRLVGLSPPINNNRLVSVLHPCVCVSHLADAAEHGPMWTVEALQTMASVTVGGTLPAGWRECCPDKYLRPLPPHDDAGVDEVIRRVALPEQHETPIGVITSVLRDMGLPAQWP